MPPGTARVYSWLTITATGATVSPKNPPARKAISRNVYSLDSRSIRFASLPNISGRRYKACRGLSVSHCASARTSMSIEERNSSSGSSGMASRAAERANRAAFRSGRNTAIEPSACTNAFIPSKITWA